MVRSLDACPRCGARVSQVSTGTVAGTGVVRPCGHDVTVVLSPDRVMLGRVAAPGGSAGRGGGRRAVALAQLVVALVRPGRPD